MGGYLQYYIVYSAVTTTGSVKPVTKKNMVVLSLRSERSDEDTTDPDNIGDRRTKGYAYGKNRRT